MCRPDGNFKFAGKMHVRLNKLQALATGRLYRATFLSNSIFLLCLIVLLLSELSELKSAELWVL